MQALQESIKSGSVPASSTLEQEENKIDIEEIMGSLEVTEEEKQQITGEKILELVANKGYTSTELIK